MNNTQIKRPKAGHAAKPPPRRETIVFAYANTIFGNPQTDRVPAVPNHKQSPPVPAAGKENF